MGRHGHRRRGRHDRGDDVIIQPALGHDDHAHPTLPYSGLTGTTPTSLGGHAADENIFFAIDARYTDSGGAGGANPLTGSATTLVFPKIKQAEFFDAKSPTLTSRRAATSRAATGWSSARTAPGRSTARSTCTGSTSWPCGSRPTRPASSSCARTPSTVSWSARPTCRPPGPRGTPTCSSTSPTPARRSTSTSSSRARERKLNFIEAHRPGLLAQDRARRSRSPRPEGRAARAGRRIEVTADAADDGQRLAKVEFFVDGESIGSDTTRRTR